MTEASPTKLRASLLAWGACVLMLGTRVTVADAQCAFARPKKASTYQVSLVPAFKGCESGTCYDDSGLTCHTDAGCAGTPICEGSLGARNAVTEGGSLIACQAPQLWPGAGWFWDPTSTSGNISMKPQKNKLFDGIVTDPNARDVAVQIALSGVRNSMSQPANGTGQFIMLTRFTLQDRTNGDMTIIDFPITRPVTLSDGKAKVKYSINATLSNDLAGLVVAGLPGCTVTQVLRIEVRDDQGVPFATPGLL